MKAFLYRSGFALFPAYSSDNDLLLKYREGEIVEVEVKKARNYKNLKRFFALLKLGFENQNEAGVRFDSMEWFRRWVIIKAGWVVSCQTPDGFMYDAKPINFASMDEFEFQELFKDVQQVICDHCKITPSQIENNLNLFC